MDGEASWERERRENIEQFERVFQEQEAELRAILAGKAKPPAKPGPRPPVIKPTLPVVPKRKQIPERDISLG